MLKFLCKGVRKIEFTGYNEGFTCRIRFDDICDARGAYIVLLNREGIKIKGYREFLRGENLNGSWKS